MADGFIAISPWRCETCGHEERDLRAMRAHIEEAHPEPPRVPVVVFPKADRESRAGEQTPIPEPLPRRRGCDRCGSTDDVHHYRGEISPKKLAGWLCRSCAHGVVEAWLRSKGGAP